MSKKVYVLKTSTGNNTPIFSFMTRDLYSSLIFLNYLDKDIPITIPFIDGQCSEEFNKEDIRKIIFQAESFNLENLQDLLKVYFLLETFKSLNANGLDLIKMMIQTLNDYRIDVLAAESDWAKTIKKLVVLEKQSQEFFENLKKSVDDLIAEKKISKW